MKEFLLQEQTLDSFYELGYSTTHFSVWPSQEEYNYLLKNLFNKVIT